MRRGGGRGSGFGEGDAGFDGFGDGEDALEAEADRLAAKLVEWGVPPSRIVVEASSRNTRENAIESSGSGRLYSVSTGCSGARRGHAS